MQRTPQRSQPSQDIYKSTSFEEWLRYLLQSGLCRMEADGRYVLRPHGRGFLKYILGTFSSISPASNYQAPSSTIRVIAGCFGFLLFTQSRDVPAR
jgi:hypothetical protein